MAIVDIENIKDLFARNLERLRKSQDLTQAELALNLTKKFQGIKVERNAIVSYETKKALPRLDVLCCIAEYFNVTVDQMLKTDLSQLDNRLHLYHLNERLLRPGSQRRTDNTAAELTPTEKDGKIAFLEEMIDEMFKAYMEANTLRFMQTQVTERVLLNLKDQAKSDIEKTAIYNLYIKELNYCIVNSTNILNVHLIDVLDNREKEIFMALKEPQNNMNLVADVFGISEDELIKMLVGIQNKIRNKYKH